VRSLDDARARRMAATLGIPVAGTLGLLLNAKKAGLVPSVGALLERLQSAGFRLDPHTRGAVLDLAGESQ
jgi:predicted nucleic acid-binding protein